MMSIRSIVHFGYEEQVKLFKTKETLYLFLDEGGNFDFSSNGTKYFTLTAVSTIRPFVINHSLKELKYDLLENDFDIEYYHAAEDKYQVRTIVFGAIKRNIERIRIDSLVVEKSKTNPNIRDVSVFYPMMLGFLLKYPLKFFSNLGLNKKLIIITDRIPIHKKRSAVEKAIKKTLSRMLSHNFEYKIFHHNSKSSLGLQIVDYCNWAVYRKWDKGEKIYYDLIKNSTRSEFDIFRFGTNHYY